MEVVTHQKEYVDIRSKLPRKLHGETMKIHERAPRSDNYATTLVHIIDMGVRAIKKNRSLTKKNEQ